MNDVTLGNRLSAAALLALSPAAEMPEPTVPLVERSALGGSASGGPLEMPRAGTTDAAAANRRRRKGERQRRNQGRHGR